MRRAKRRSRRMEISRSSCRASASPALCRSSQCRTASVDSEADGSGTADIEERFLQSVGGRMQDRIQPEPFKIDSKRSSFLVRPQQLIFDRLPTKNSVDETTESGMQHGNLAESGRAATCRAPFSGPSRRVANIGHKFSIFLFAGRGRSKCRLLDCRKFIAGNSLCTSPDCGTTLTVGPWLPYTAAASGCQGKGFPARRREALKFGSRTTRCLTHYLTARL